MIIMKLILLLSLVAFAAGKSHDAKIQQDILRLLYKMSEPIPNKFADLKNKASNFDPLSGSYLDQGTAVKILMNSYNKHTLLEKHHYFCLFITEHREDAIKLFGVLINSKDWNTFVSVAAFFREKMNEGSFVYAMYTATMHSFLTMSVTLPPLYEVTPHLYANSEVMMEAYRAKMMQTPAVIHMNFTGTKKNTDQKVAYFGEDIGMNMHHVTWHMKFPFWWKNEKYGHSIDRKGEIFFWMHHQLMTRYNAERLSNWLPMAEKLNWNKPIKPGFAPHVMYRYGGELPMRVDYTHMEDVDTHDNKISIRDLEDFESRITASIDLGYVKDKDGNHVDIINEKGIEILGDIVESSKCSKNPGYYGSLHNMGHIIIGRQSDPKGKFGMPPGIMEHFETATRDPAFFTLHKYIDDIFKRHKDTLPSYTKQDLIFPGVTLKEVRVNGKLETYMENFKFNLEMGVDSGKSVADVPISAEMHRMNHKPFTVEYEIKNTKSSNVMSAIRVFMCPRKDKAGTIFTHDEGRWHCIEMDKFWRMLKPGMNTVVRKSEEVSTTISDTPSLKTLMKKADDAVNSGSAWTMPEQKGCGIPQRMLLPKGKKEGMEFALFVAVTDASKDTNIPHLENDKFMAHTLCGVHGELYPEKKPLGFPIDRKIPKGVKMQDLPNMHLSTVKIYHHCDE